MILVGYATAHGSTKGIAEAIGARLAREGLFVEVRPLEEVRSLETYEAFVLGSALHDMSWLPPAAAFVNRHAAELARRPTWLFSVGSLGETTSFLRPKVTAVFRRWRKDTKQMASFRAAIEPRGHRHFAGAIERDHWNWVGDLFFSLVGDGYGDHRDWADIDAWADGIARDLARPETRATPLDHLSR